MFLYRITHKKYSTRLFASGMEGRWNSAGKKVIYCAESIALAFLENMVRRQGIGFNDLFKIMIIKVPDILAVSTIEGEDLEKAWRSFNDYSYCQPPGDKWFDECKTPLLKVPSAILPENHNYIINTEHPDYKKIQLVQTTDLVPDERIEAILKKYKKQ
jgi:RES domain-containing protein